MTVLSVRRGPKGSGRTGQSKNDIKEQDGCETLQMTRTPFHLEPNVVRPRLEKCADDAPCCSHEQKCACVRASGKVFCVHTVAFSELRLTGRERN